MLSDRQGHLPEDSHENLPNQLVIKNYIELYKLLVLSEATLVSKTATYIESFTSKDLTKIVADVFKELKGCIRKEDWWNFSFYLREQAEYSQSLKNTSDDSRLCCNLHAAANLTIYELREKQPDFFETKRKALLVDIANKKTEKNFNRENRRGLGVPLLRVEISSIRKKLAYLGNNNDIDKAIQSGLFEKSVLPTVTDLNKYDNGHSTNCSKTASYDTPLHLQLDYAEWLYTYRTL